MNTMFACVAATVLATSSLAQSWSITGSVPVPGTCSASQMIGGGSNTASGSLPIGPVVPGTLLACNVGTIANANASWTTSLTGQVAPLATDFTFRAVAHGSFNYSSQSTLDATIDVTLFAPALAHGLLRVQATPSGMSLASASIDVDANGTIDWSGSAPGSGSVATLPLVVPPTGVVLRVHGQVFTQAPMGLFLNSGSIAVSLEFHPTPALVTPFAVGNAPLSISMPTWDSVTLSMSPASLNPLLIVVGFAPTFVPITPTLVQLVTVDLVVPGAAWTAPLPPLPAGFALYAQGLAADPTTGGLVGTDSVRALWW